MGRLARALFLLIGLGLIGVLLTQVELAQVTAYLHEMGWNFPLIFLPYIVVYLFDTLGWKLAFGPALSVPFHILFLTRVAGEAVNNLTPFAYLGGEPVKAHLLTRFQIPIIRGMAAAIIAKLLISLSQFIFVVLGGILVLSHLMTRPDVLWPLMLLIAALGLLLTGLSYGLRVGLFTLLYRVLDHWTLTPSFMQRWRAQLRQLDETIVAFYRHYPWRLIRSLGLHFLGWVAGTLEVLAIFHAVGIPVDVAEAIAIEALTGVVKAVAFFIPGSLGVQDGGNVLLLAVFGYPSSFGLTFSLVRRMRELLWISMGLLVLVRHYGWRSRPGRGPGQSDA
jgi:glycosyltransferase 2 family protein